MLLMTPDEVMRETAEKLTRQLAVPLHNNLTKFGNEKLEALKKTNTDIGTYHRSRSSKG